MAIGVVTFAVTCDAAGAGTVSSARALREEVLSIRMPNAGTALTNGAGAGGTTDITITRAYDGGTIAALSNVTAPFQYQPRDPIHSLTGGTTSYALGFGPIPVTEGVPVWGTATVTVASGAPSSSGTVYMLVRR